jgi:hypothetical protein
VDETHRSGSTTNLNTYNEYFNETEYQLTTKLELNYENGNDIKYSAIIRFGWSKTVHENSK